MSIKIGDINKLSQEDRKQFDRLLAQMPELRSKLDSARELNTGNSPESEVIKSAASDDEMPDYSSIINEQREAADVTVKPTHIGAGNVDAKKSFMQASVRPEDQESEERKQKEDFEAREQGFESSQHKLASERPEKTKPAAAPKFQTEGKLHPVLSKMREALGMEVQERFVNVAIGGSVYRLHRLNREDVIKATSLATMRSRVETEIRGTIEEAILCFAIKAIDDVELVDVFGIIQEDHVPALKRVARLSMVDRRERAAHQMLDFLREAPNELTESLIAHYEQEFPPYNLLAKDTATAFCPKDNCLYKAILHKDEKRFCPIHGVELFREDSLPNPF